MYCNFNSLSPKAMRGRLVMDNMHVTLYHSVLSYKPLSTKPLEERLCGVVTSLFIPFTTHKIFSILVNSTPFSRCITF